MAFAIGGVGDRVKMFLRFLGNDGQRAVWRQFDVKWDTDLATTLANATAVADIVANVSGMEVSLGHVQVDITDASPDAAENNATRFQDGIFTFQLDTTGQGKSPYGNVRIPYPKLALRVAATGSGLYQILVNNAAITALEDEYLAAGRLTLNDGQSAIDLEGAKVVPVRGKVQ